MECKTCGGTGIRKEVSVVKLNNQGLHQVSDPENLTEGGLFQEAMFCSDCEGTGVINQPTRCPKEKKMVEYIPVFGGWKCPSCGYYTKDPNR